MKKWSRISKNNTRKAKRSKKLTRKALNRRRQRGGGSIVVNCTLNPATGAITAISADPSITASSPAANTVTITTTQPVKNIQFGSATSAKVGSGTGITLQDLADSKSVIPTTSYLYARALTGVQKKLDMAAGSPFPAGLKVTNLNAANLGITGTAPTPFIITITT